MWYGLEIYPHHLFSSPFRIVNGGGRLNGARFPNQTNPTYLNKKNEYLNKKIEEKQMKE
jgi:hypothetical protein